MKKLLVTIFIAISILFAFFTHGHISVLEAKNVFEDILNAYQNYEQANMMLWLTGDVKAEKRVGKEMKWVLELTNKKYKNPEATRWVKSVFDRVKAQYRNRGFDYNITLLQGDTVNAFAIPGGYIYIYKGMLDFVGSDDELAAVLAHELAHAERRHSLIQLRKNAAFQLLLQKAVKNTRDRDSWGQVVGAFLALKFSRDDENEADEIGQVRMAQAGFNPVGQVVLWEKFVQKYGKGEKGLAQYLSTHPPSQERVERAKSRLPSLAPTQAAALKAAPNIPASVVASSDLTLSFNILSNVSENLLQNGSFENDLSQKGIPDAWSIKEGKAVLDKNKSITGRASLRLESSSQFLPARAVSEMIALKPNERYALSGWVCASESARVSVGAEVYDKSKHLRCYIWPVISGANITSNWREFEGVFESGASPTMHLPKDAAYIKIVLQNGPLSKGSVWFDDLRLRHAEIPKTDNLLENGDFEYADENGLPKGVVAPPNTIRRDLEHFKTGYASLRINAVVSGETSIELSQIPVDRLKAGKQIQGSFYCDGTATIKGKLRLTLLDEAGNSIGRHLVERDFTTKPNLWQAIGFKTDFKLKQEETKSVRSIGIEITADIPATATLWLDNVVIK